MADPDRRHVRRGVRPPELRRESRPAPIQAWDALDRSDPPLAPEPALSLYFPDEDTGGDRLTTDIRPPIADQGDPVTRGHAWAFDVVRSGSAEPCEARIELTGLDRVPAGLEVRLIDRVLERAVDLRLHSAYTCVLGRRDFVDASRARFELRVGSPEFIASGADPAARPRATRLLPVFPNPVASSGAVRFETALAGRVALRVFDAAGRRVRTLADRTFEPGLHELVWRGDDDHGRRVAPGLYLVNLIAPDRTDTRKLVIAP